MPGHDDVRKEGKAAANQRGGMTGQLGWEGGAWSVQAWGCSGDTGERTAGTGCAEAGGSALGTGHRPREAVITARGGLIVLEGCAL